MGEDLRVRVLTSGKRIRGRSPSGIVRREGALLSLPPRGREFFELSINLGAHGRALKALGEVLTLIGLPTLGDLHEFVSITILLFVS